MAGGAPELRWGVAQRLEFIEFRLFWEGGVNRSDITTYFGVSVPQASKDLSQYQELAPANIRYDRSEKRYFAADDFKPVFLKPDADRYLVHLQAIGQHVRSPEETWLSQVPSFEILPLPRRNIEPNILRTVLSAIRKREAIEIRYQSLSAVRPKPIWRWISPHALGFEGMRWHARAFCHIDRQFKDFLLPRCFGIRNCGPAEAQSEEDVLWHEKATVALKPNPGLTEEQRGVVARDFGMRHNEVRVEVRLALLYYFLRRLGLEFDAGVRSPREQHVVLANPDAVRRALDRAQYKKSA